MYITLGKVPTSSRLYDERAGNNDKINVGSCEIDNNGTVYHYYCAPGVNTLPER